MVRAPLHQYVARPQERFTLLHDRVDLAFDHDRVVHGGRLVHHRVGVSARLGVRRADRFEAFVTVRALRPAGVGRELDHAEDGAVRLRLKMHRSIRRVGAADVARRRAGGLPEIGQREPGEGRGHFLDARRRAVRKDDRAALRVVAGYDATNLLDHATASLAAIFLRAFFAPARSGARRKSNARLRLFSGSPTFFASALESFSYFATSESLTA